MKWLAVLIALLALPATASADVEPNDDFFQAEGPVTTAGPVTGTIQNRDDQDWYLVYVNGQTQTDFALTATRDNGCTVTGRLYDHDVQSQASVGAYDLATEHLRYTTPPGVSRVFIRVTSCEGEPYTLTFGPAAAFVAGEPAGPGTPTGEPNESAAQPFGPLVGGTLYSGAIETVNDADWLYFHTAGPAELDIPVAANGQCSVDARLYTGSALDSSLASSSAFAGQTHIRYTAPAAGTYLLRLTSCAGTRYQVRVFPPASITATPPPPTAVSAPSTTARVRGSKVRIVLKGRLGVPAGVDAGRACNGATIVFSIKRGKTLISARTVRLTRSCRFNKTVNLSRSKVGGTKRLKITARFQGNALLSSTTKNFSVRVRG